MKGNPLAAGIGAALLNFFLCVIVLNISTDFGVVLLCYVPGFIFGIFHAVAGKKILPGILMILFSSFAHFYSSIALRYVSTEYLNDPALPGLPMLFVFGLIVFSFALITNLYPLKFKLIPVIILAAGSTFTWLVLYSCDFFTEEFLHWSTESSEASSLIVVAAAVSLFQLTISAALQFGLANQPKQ